MKIKFMGAAGTVTGSSYVLTSDSGQSILIDLGMFQGPTALDQLNYQPYEFDCQLSGAILTHAHLDHCGRLPILRNHGYQGKMWMTAPTRDLTEIALLDSAKIAKQDEKPYLYDKNLALDTIDQFVTTNYHQPVHIGDFTIVFRDAGHILGSASLEITDERSSSAIRKIVFSGDLGNTPEPLEQATELTEQADMVVMESTYGDRLHPTLDPVEAVQMEINAVEKNGGTLLIPAFSLERTQELLHMIMHLKKTNKVAPETPIYMDSPMAEKATQVYLHYPELFNPHIQADLKIGNPFDFPGLQVVSGREQSEAIDEHSGGKVIMAGSGMMTGGRIVGHAAHYLPMSTTRLLIVGFQGEGTLGRALLEGQRQVRIEGLPIEVKATVTQTQAMSSHADQRQLLDWLKHMQNVKKVFLTHGDDPARKILADKITTELGLHDITLPSLHQETDLD